jgi:hypothetical protein
MTCSRDLKRQTLIKSNGITIIWQNKNHINCTLLISDITIDVWFDYNATETRGAVVKLIISSAITGKANQPQFSVFFS